MQHSGMMRSYLATFICILIKLISTASEDVSNGELLCFVRGNAEWLWKNLTLSWSLPETSENMSVRLEWHYDNDNQSKQICPNKTSNRCPVITLTSITWDASYIDLKDLVATIEVMDSLEKVVFKSTGSYELNKCSKPPAVDGLNVTVTNTSITISSGYTFSRERICRLNYTSEWTGEQKSLLRKGGGAQYSTFTAYNLTAFTNYHVTIECSVLDYKGDQVGHWSDAKQDTVKTDEGIPSKSPAMTEGGYSAQDHLCSTTGKRQVTVFWKRLPPKNRHGVILNYRLDVTTDSSSVPSTHIIERDDISIVLELLCDQTYVLKLTAGTRIGFSIIPSILEISAVTNNVFPRVSYVIPEQSKDILQISWVMDISEPILSFNLTVFWCLGNQLHGCQTNGSVDWMNVNDTHTPITLRLQEGRDPSDFMFGASTVYNSFTRGIIWNQCLFQKDSDITQPPANVQLLASGLEGSMLVTWDSIPCTRTGAYVKYYNITFCEVKSNPGNCTEHSRNIIVKGQQTSCTIPGLDKRRLYGIQLSAVGKKGNGPKSDMIIGKPLSGNSSKNSFPILEVLLGLGCPMVCCCIACCSYCKFKKYLKERRNRFKADVSYVKVTLNRTYE